MRFTIILISLQYTLLSQVQLYKFLDATTFTASTERALNYLLLARSPGKVEYQNKEALSLPAHTHGIPCFVKFKGLFNNDKYRERSEGKNKQLFGHICLDFCLSFNCLC